MNRSFFHYGIADRMAAPQYRFFCFIRVIFIKPIISYYAYYNALMQKNKLKIEKNNNFLKEIQKNRNYRARARQE